MCFICLQSTHEYICANCNSHDSRVCQICIQDTVLCPYCKKPLDKEWIVDITFANIIELFKSLNMYKHTSKGMYDINDLELDELSILIRSMDTYINHHFNALPNKSKDTVRLVRKKIALRISTLSYIHQLPTPIRKCPYVS